MYEYIEGSVSELNPTYAVVDCQGVGYLIHISLTTFSQIQGQKSIRLYTHQVVREDAHLLYGFRERFEREVFRLLLSVSGIGPNTARMMLSSMTPEELQRAILTENIHVLKAIKGIGIKSAQRLVVELKDKIGKEGATDEIFSVKDNTLRDEALSALVLLGFPKGAVDKVLSQVLAESTNIEVEDLIKLVLRRL